MIRAQQTISSLAIVLVTAILMITAGCAKTVLVYRDESGNKKLPGIMYYAKKGVYKQTTVYRRSYLRVSLKITEILPPENQGAKNREVSRPTMTINVPKDKDGSNALQEFAVFLNRKISATDAVRKFGDLPKIDITTLSWEKSPVSNSVVLTTEVDYQNTYYINSNSPWFGSGSLNAELHADGTLTKADATVEPGIAEGLPELIPFKEFLEARHVVTTTASPDTDPEASYAAFRVPAGQEVPTHFSLNIIEVGELKVLQRVLPVVGQDHANNAPIPITWDGPFTIRPLQVAAGASDEQSAGWKFTGSAVRPDPERGIAADK